MPSMKPTPEIFNILLVFLSYSVGSAFCLLSIFTISARSREYIAVVNRVYWERTSNCERNRVRLTEEVYLQGEYKQFSHASTTCQKSSVCPRREITTNMTSRSPSCEIICVSSTDGHYTYDHI